MPELPEVETTRCGVAPHVIGAKVSELIVRQPRLRWPIPDDLIDRITGQPLLDVQRRAKYLLFVFPQGVVMVHLGMSGRLCVLPAGEEPGKHDHVDIEFDNGQCLRYTDPRRFGAVLWSDNPTEHELICNLGPEPLTDAFDAQRLFQRSRGKTQAVKTFIMDNHVVVGVGNIYANEALFMAGILPSRAAGRISLQRYEKLTAAIKEVLARAIAQGGTTLRDFLGSDGKPGYFKQELHVYGRKGEPCVACGKSLIETRLGQRSTIFCKQCQR